MKKVPEKNPKDKGENNSKDAKTPAGFEAENLRCIYSSLMSRQIDFSERKWETIKAASVLATGALVIAGGIASNQLIAPNFKFLGMFLIGFGIFQFCWVLYNLRKEYELQLRDEFTLYQIEKELGLHKKIEKGGWLGKDIPHHLFDSKHINPSFRRDQPKKSVDRVYAWVKDRVRRFLRLFDSIHTNQPKKSVNPVDAWVKDSVSPFPRPYEVSLLILLVLGTIGGLLLSKGGSDNNASNSTLNSKLQASLQKAAQNNWTITVMANQLKESNKNLEKEYSFHIESDLLRVLRRMGSEETITTYLPLSRLSWISEDLTSPKQPKLKMLFQ